MTPPAEEEVDWEISPEAGEAGGRGEERDEPPPPPRPHVFGSPSPATVTPAGLSRPVKDSQMASAASLVSYRFRHCASPSLASREVADLSVDDVEEPPPPKRPSLGGQAEEDPSHSSPPPPPSPVSSCRYADPMWTGLG